MGLFSFVQTAEATVYICHAKQSFRIDENGNLVSDESPYFGKNEIIRFDDVRGSMRVALDDEHDFSIGGRQMRVVQGIKKPGWELVAVSKLDLRVGVEILHIEDHKKTGIMHFVHHVASNQDRLNIGTCQAYPPLVPKS